MNKKKRTFLQNRFREALFEADTNITEVAKSNGVFRSQLSASISGYQRISKKIALVISKFTGLPLETVQIADGTLPDWAKKLCKEKPDEVIAALDELRFIK